MVFQFLIGSLQTHKEHNTKGSNAIDFNSS